MSSAQSQVLKSLANKMYAEEVKDYEAGKTKEKPKPLSKEVKQTKEEKKEVAEKKIDDSLKKMVRGFFQKKKSESPTYVAALEARKPSLRGGKDCGKKSGKSRKKKAVI